MLDGRIDVQGTIADLQEQGIIDMLRQDASSHVKENAVGGEPASTSDSDSGNDKKTDIPEPRKLIEESSTFEQYCDHQLNLSG
jgi:hypothetical protein